MSEHVGREVLDDLWREETDALARARRAVVEGRAVLTQVGYYCAGGHDQDWRADVSLGHHWCATTSECCEVAVYVLTKVQPPSIPPPVEPDAARPDQRPAWDWIESCWRGGIPVRLSVVGGYEPETIDGVIYGIEGGSHHETFLRVHTVDDNIGVVMDAVISCEPLDPCTDCGQIWLHAGCPTPRGVTTQAAAPKSPFPQVIEGIHFSVADYATLIATKDGVSITVSRLLFENNAGDLLAVLHRQFAAARKP